VPFSGRGIDAHQARAVRAKKQLAPVRRARRGSEAIARKPGVREDEGAHRLREWRLRERGAGVEWRDALPRLRERPVWHGKELPAVQESSPGGDMHEHSDRL